MQAIQRNKSGTETALEDITSGWSTGIPTSIRFLGKSFHAVPKGPGGLILNESPKCESPTKLKAPNNADFTNTSNMLTMLSKAETKLKAQAALKAGIYYVPKYLGRMISVSNDFWTSITYNIFHYPRGGDGDHSADGESARNSPGQMLSAGVGRSGKRSKAGSRAGSPGGSSHEGSIARADQSHSLVRYPPIY